MFERVPRFVAGAAPAVAGFVATGGVTNADSPGRTPTQIDVPVGACGNGGDVLGIPILGSCPTPTTTPGSGGGVNVDVQVGGAAVDVNVGTTPTTAAPAPPPAPTPTSAPPSPAPTAPKARPSVNTSRSGVAPPGHP